MKHLLKREHIDSTLTLSFSMSLAYSFFDVMISRIHKAFKALLQSEITQKWGTEFQFLTFVSTFFVCVYLLHLELVASFDNILHSVSQLHLVFYTTCISCYEGPESSYRLLYHQGFFNIPFYFVDFVEKTTVRGRCGSQLEEAVSMQSGEGLLLMYQGKI